LLAAALRAASPAKYRRSESTEFRGLTSAVLRWWREAGRRPAREQRALRAICGICGICG